MTRHYVFNGDSDGLCALQQLRLAGGRDGELITGVKRDISLLGRVKALAGDECTVLDVSLDTNRDALIALLDAGVSIVYFDHHFAGEVPRHEKLLTHLDPSPDVCTSLLVDRHLGGRFRHWAAVGAFGDNLLERGRALAQEAGLAPQTAERLKELGVVLNYNAYGEAIEDLHVDPAGLAEDMLRHEDPLSFIERSTVWRGLLGGFTDDMERVRRLEPARKAARSILFVLPDAAWARRVSGTLANDVSRAHPGSAVAIASPKASGGYVISVRVPSESPVSADAFCRLFPTGGGRRTAAGINLLPSDELERFATAFERQFRTGQDPSS